MYALYVSETQRATYNGVWRSLANAPALGAGDRRFESCHSDETPEMVFPYDVLCEENTTPTLWGVSLVEMNTM